MSDRYLIRTRWLDGTQTYHASRMDWWDWCEYVDFDGVRHFKFPGLDRVARWEVRTRCGLLVDWWDCEHDGEGSFVSVTPDVAERIARPCRRCFDVEGGR